MFRLEIFLNTDGNILFNYDSFPWVGLIVGLAWSIYNLLRKNKDVTVTLEGHADERGTREYNLALGERRANAVKDYLMTYGISGNRLSVISYGKEKPVNTGSTPLAWSQNRRAVTVKVN